MNEAMLPAVTHKAASLESDVLAHRITHSLSCREILISTVGASLSTGVHYHYYHKPARQHMAMLYWPLAVYSFYREACVFPPVGLEEPLNILKPFLAQVNTLMRTTNTPNLVGIGSQGAPPHSGELSRFCVFCSPFSVSSSRLQVSILDRFTRLIAQTTCSVS